jgi:hypothetical protein
VRVHGHDAAHRVENFLRRYGFHVHIDE